jgi:predicted porin
VSFGTAEAGAGWQITPAALVAADYGYVTGKVDATGQHPRYHQFNLFSSYALSVRTVAYALAAYQLASGDAHQAQITGFNASSTNRQVVLRVGLQHVF